MRELLQRLLLKPGVDFAALMDLDGFCLDSVAAPLAAGNRVPGEPVAVLAGALCAAAKAVSQAFGGGASRHLCVCQTNGVFHIHWLGERHTVVMHAVSFLTAQDFEALLLPLDQEFHAALAASTTTPSGIFSFGDDIELADLSSLTFD